MDTLGFDKIAAIKAADRDIFEPDTGQYESMEEVFGPCAGAALYRKSMPRTGSEPVTSRFLRKQKRLFKLPYESGALTN
ncbi:putative glycosyltransferase [groundwater metagenome]